MDDAAENVDSEIILIGQFEVCYSAMYAGFLFCFVVVLSCAGRVQASLGKFRDKRSVVRLQSSLRDGASFHRSSQKPLLIRHLPRNCAPCKK